jgi:hypothetical protein
MYAAPDEGSIAPPQATGMGDHEDELAAASQMVVVRRMIERAREPGVRVGLYQEHYDERRGAGEAG